MVQTGCCCCSCARACNRASLNGSIRSVILRIVYRRLSDVHHVHGQRDSRFVATVACLRSSGSSTLKSELSAWRQIILVLIVYYYYFFGDCGVSSTTQRLQSPKRKPMTKRQPAACHVMQAQMLCLSVWEEFGAWDGTALGAFIRMSCMIEKVRIRIRLTGISTHLLFVQRNMQPIFYTNIRT
jgi:hypothetical protein